MIRYGLHSSSLVFRHFEGDDLSIIFDARSGDTHMLDRVACEVCQMLAGAPASAEEIRRSLSMKFADEDSRMMDEAIDAAIERLRHAGLLGNVSN